MWLDVSAMALFLIIGNVVFHHFDPMMSLWKRVLKILAILALTALVSYLFGRTGVIVMFAAAFLPVVYIHAIWLPKHGINGWTGEPREKYYALRGWMPPKH
jgi:hypothetical protein